MTPGTATDASAPYANIGPRGCTRRGRMGWVWLAIGAIVVIVLTVRDAPVGWYAVTALPFFMGVLGYFQAREQTCVFHAAFDQRDMDGGPERITDPGILSRVRDKARGIWLRSLIGTGVLTAVALAIGAFVA